MASILQAYPPNGVSLGMAALSRMLLVPALAGVAVSLLTDSNVGGWMAVAWLLGVELSVRRRRWAWQRLDVSPTGVEGLTNPAERRHLLRHYGLGIAAFAAGLAFWQAADGAGLDHTGGLTGLVLAVLGAAAGHLGFEYLMRSPRFARFRPQIGDDEVLETGELTLLVFLLPKVFWRAAATLIAGLLAVFLHLLFGWTLVLGAADSLTDPASIGFALFAVAMIAVSAFWTAMVEANNAATYAAAHRPPSIKDGPATDLPSG